MAALRTARTASLLPRLALATARRCTSKPAYQRGLATASTSSLEPVALFQSLDTFTDRHIGPNDDEVQQMLSKLGYESMDAFVSATVPQHIRIQPTGVDDTAIPALTESELLHRARTLADLNLPFKSYIGMGYHNAVVPSVILRNVCGLYLSVIMHNLYLARSSKTPPGTPPTPLINQR